MICEHLHDLYTELPFRLKGTDKIHAEGMFKFPSNIYSVLFEYDTTENFGINSIYHNK